MKIIENLLFCIQDIFITYRPLYILTVFETAERKMKTMSLKHALWWYLKRFGTAEK